MKIATPRTCVARSVRSLRLALGLLFPLAFLPALPAANGTWDGGGTDANWTTLANWTGDTAFPGATSGTTSTDIATFNTAIANTWGASGTPILIDSATFNLGGITFATAAGNYVIGTTGGNPLYLTSGGTIQMLSTITNASALETISAPLVIMGTDATYTFNNALNQNNAGFTLNGPISAGSSGNASLTFSAASAHSTNTVNGVISNGSASSLGLTIAAGSWTFAGNNTYTGDTTINAGSATFTGANSGGGTFTAAAGSITFTGANTYAGPFVSNGGYIYLGTDTVSTGSLLDVTSISINSGGRLYLDNVAGNADRLDDSVALSLGGANALFNLASNASADTSEKIGTITINPGYSSINLSTGSNRLTTLTAASLTRAAGFGTLALNATNLGSLASNSTRLYLTATTPSGVGSGGTPSAINSNIKNLSIIPWIYATDGNGTKFVTYDSTNGLRALSNNEYQASITAATAPTGSGTGDNVRLTTDDTGLTTKTINALMLAPGAAQSVTGAGTGNTLTISSGALFNTGTQTTTLSGFDSVIFGNNEAVIILADSRSSLVMNSAIAVTGDGGLTKTGGGNLILNTTNTYTGPTTINQGTLTLGSSGDLGSAASPVFINGNGASSYAATLSVGHSGTLNFGTTTGGGVLTQTAADSTVVLNQSGAGNTLGTVSGVSGSTLTFAGDGTGITTINTALASAGQLIKVTSGTVNLAASRNIAVNLEIDGGIVNTIDNQTGFNTTAGPQTFTITAGQFNTLGTYGLSGFNSSGDSTSSDLSHGGYANTFTGLQTGGTVTITGISSNTRFVLGSGIAGASTTYSLQGGIFDATGAVTFRIGADTGGSSTSTFNLSGGKLLVAGSGNQQSSYIAGAQGTGAKQSFVWTGGILATVGYDATKLTSTAGTAVSSSTNTLVNGGGTLAPGDIGTTGRTTIIGNYSVTSSTAALAIDIAGTNASFSFQDAPGTGFYDNVYESNGNFNFALDGKLSVNLLDGFNGAGTFTIINNARSGGTVTGTFNNTVEDAYAEGQRVVLADGLGSYLVHYNPQTVTLDSYLADNSWAGLNGSNWSEASNWSAFSPQAAGHIAQFNTQASGGIVNLDTDRTIGGITFDDATDSYTLSTDTDHTLTLDNTGISGPADSAITVANGTHRIDVPLALNNNLVVTTTHNADALAISGVISGTGHSLTKSGAGSLTLSGLNTYDGGTRVTAGTLFVDGSIGAGAVTVLPGATLGGTGIIHGATTLQGILAAGNAATPVGTLTFESTLALSGTASFDLAGVATGGVDYDQIALQSGGTLSSGATLSLTIGDQFLTALNTAGGTATLTLFTGAAPSGAFTSIALTGTDSGSASGQTITGTSGLNYTYNGDGTLTVMASAIPEPATWTALAGLLALLATLALRRRPLRSRLA